MIKKSVKIVMVCLGGHIKDYKGRRKPFTDLVACYSFDCVAWQRRLESDDETHATLLVGEESSLKIVRSMIEHARG